MLRRVALVGTEVRRDDERITANGVGRAFGDDGAGLHAIHPVGDRHDQRQVVLDDNQRRVELLLHPFDQRAERLGFSLFLAALVAVICVAIGLPFTYQLTRLTRRLQVLWLVE